MVDRKEFVQHGRDRAADPALLGPLDPAVPPRHCHPPLPDDHVRLRTPTGLGRADVRHELVCWVSEQSQWPLLIVVWRIAAASDWLNRTDRAKYGY